MSYENCSCAPARSVVRRMALSAWAMLALSIAECHVTGASLSTAVAGLSTPAAEEPGASSGAVSGAVSSTVRLACWLTRG